MGRSSGLLAGRLRELRSLRGQKKDGTGEDEDEFM